MAKESLPVRGNKSFEDLKKINEHGAEYWSARDLQPLLGYGQWRRFEDAIKRAITSCKQSGNEPDHHFADAGKMIELGKGGMRDVPDYHLILKVTSRNLNSTQRQGKRIGVARLCTNRKQTKYKMSQEQI